MAKYLDGTGLTYVAKKIKSLLASKQDLLTFDDAPKKNRRILSQAAVSIRHSTRQMTSFLRLTLLAT